MDDAARLPVLRAYAATFAVIGSRLSDILRVAVVPTAVSLAIVCLVAPSMTASLVDMASLDPDDPANATAMLNAMGVFFGGSLGLAALTAIVNSLIYAGLLRMLIRGETTSLPVYLGFGKDEINILLGWLMLNLVMFGVSIATNILAAASTLLGPAVGGLFAFAVGIGSNVLTIWISLRLSLICAAAVSQNRVGFKPSFSVTAGQAWSLFGYWILIGLPFVIACIVVIMALPTGVNPLEAMAGGGAGEGGQPTPEQIREVNAGVIRWLGSLLDASTLTGQIRLALFFLLSLAWNIVTATAGGVAWRFMTDDADAQAARAATP